MKLIQFVFICTLLHITATQSLFHNKQAYDDNQDPRLWQNSGKFEGDIILTQEQKERLRNDEKFRNGIIDIRFRWPNRKIPYIISNDFAASEKNFIESTLKEDYSRTCFRVVPRKNETDYVYVTADTTGCWSHIGRLGGKQELNLQRDGCIYYGSIIHEFLHAAGFYHQHSAPERDNFVTIQWQNIISGREEHFIKYGANVVSSFGQPYDYGSLMHYDAYAFSKNSQKTIVTKDPNAVIGKATKLSPIDIIKLNRMYGCAASLKPIFKKE